MYYENENSNIHRGAHALAARATDAYEAAREKVRRFLGAGSPNDVVFTRGATEAINLVAHAWGRRNVRQGAERPDAIPDDPKSADAAEPPTLSRPCPCCGGRMLIIETFARGCEPRYRPAAA
jgi:Aminotransferase class-V